MTSPLMLPALLACRAADTPGGLCLVEAETDTRVTYKELHDSSLRVARGLRTIGVAAGDTVATMLQHSIDTYRVWFGLSRLGALEVPIGTRYRGRMLEHIIKDSGARVLIIDAQFLDAVRELPGPGQVKTIVVRGLAPREPEFANIDIRPFAGLLDSGEPSPGETWYDPQAHDLALVLYTSGTTGPSKGVLVPWGQVRATVRRAFPDGTFTPGKVLYGPFPGNHIGGRIFPGEGIEFGVPAVIRDTFSASAYWDDVARYGCTTTALVSAMATILWNAPERPDDAKTSLVEALMNPVIPEYVEFSRRFGVRLCTDYNMTEISVPFHTGWGVGDWRTCGVLRGGEPGYEVRLVDACDYPVATGEVGELICRTDEPWTLNAGYLGRAEETARAWRNGWFHTGDAFRMDAAGNYSFVDRIKDAIRRRGENISSFEIEREILDHPDVVDAAAIGVPSALGEEDILVFVVARPGSCLTEADLITYVAGKAARFMVPQRIEFVTELPRTEGTQKVQKAMLRAIEARRRSDTDAPTYQEKSV